MLHEWAGILSEYNDPGAKTALIDVAGLYVPGLTESNVPVNGVEIGDAYEKR